MVVKIRLARFGKRHAPFYNIVVAQARTARNSKPMEVLGTYDPIPRVPPADSTETGRKYKDIKLDISRAKYWLGVGAQPSDPAWRLLSMVGLLEPKWKLKMANQAAMGKGVGVLEEVRSGSEEVRNLREEKEEEVEEEEKQDKTRTDAQTN